MATSSRQRQSTPLHALATGMGISELAVTWEFPIAKVAFGYTREKHTPGEAAIRGFRHGQQHDGKYPVFAVGNQHRSAARHVVGKGRARVPAPPGRDSNGTTQRERRDGGNCLRSSLRRKPSRRRAETIRLLIHTLSHLLLRGLDDGQIGFAEASLAEWLVPETLTFAVYANTLKDFTLGSLWTLLNNRALSLATDSGRPLRTMRERPDLLRALAALLRAMFVPDIWVPDIQRWPRPRDTLRLPAI